MPYKSEKLRLPEQYDKRVKIPKSEHDTIRKLFTDSMAIRAIARKYGVDKRTIQFILFPERIEAMRKNRDWRDYSNRKKLTEATRGLRRRKHKLYLEGKI
jgi:hypothetical protein